MKLFTITLIALSLVGCKTGNEISKNTANTVADLLCTGIHYGATLVSTVGDKGEQTVSNAVSTVTSAVK